MNIEVSILMPAHNVEKFIRQSIQSVIDQEYNDWELLICDDYSSDSTKEIAMEMASVDQRIIFLENKSTPGAAVARNICLKASRGRYIAFLDSDDMWSNEKLGSQIKYMKTNDLMMSHCDYSHISETGKSFGEIVFTPKIITKRMMSFSNFLPCLTVVYDSHLIGKTLTPIIKKRNDYALWLRIFHENPELISVKFDKSLATYRVNSYGLSSNRREALYYHWLALQIGGYYHPAYAAVLTCFYLFIVFFKKFLPVAYSKMINS